MFTLEGPHIVMSRTDAQNGLDFHFKLHATFFPKITLAVFLELRFKLRVSLRMKMGAIIRLDCFIKTKNHVNTVQNFTFQSVNYQYNALFYFVFSKVNKIFVYFRVAIYPTATWKKLFRGFTSDEDGSNHKVRFVSSKQKIM
jgi:hypothetical protein